MREFEWMETGATPELADLGKRIAACLRKHGYTEREWLIRCLSRNIAEFGIGRLHLIISQDESGQWKTSSWRPA